MWYEIGIKILKILICFGIVFESFIIEFLIHLLTNNLIFIVWVYRLCILFYPSVCFHRYWMSWLLQLCNKFWDQVVLILQLHSIFQSCFGYFDYSSAFFFFHFFKNVTINLSIFLKKCVKILIGLHWSYQFGENCHFRIESSVNSVLSFHLFRTSFILSNIFKRLVLRSCTSFFKPDPMYYYFLML